MRNLLFLLVLGLWIGADAELNGIFEDEFVIGERLEPLSKQPIVYRDLPFKCVHYTVQTTSTSSKSSARLLAYVQTTDQFDKKMEDRTDEYIEGSVCSSGGCSKDVRLPEEAVGDPFYIILVNARHEKPLQEAPADEKVDVTVTVKSCDERKTGVVIAGARVNGGTTKSEVNEGNVIEGVDDGKGDGDNDRLIIILVCTIGGVVILLSCVMCCSMRRKFIRNEYEYPKKALSLSDNGAPLAAHHRPQEPDSPVGGIEDPVPPPAYEPPARDSPVSARGDFSAQEEEPVTAAPTRVFNNTLWGRIMSKRGSVKLQTIGTYAERQGANVHVPSQGHDMENQAWPTPEGSRSNRRSSEEAPRPIFHEEELRDQNKNVFFNSVFSRVRSGFQGSFKSFTSFGDRGDRNTGVKLKSITSMFKAKGKNVPSAKTGPEAISEGVERSSSDSSAGAQYSPGAQNSPDKLSVVAEDSHFPGAEHLDLSSDEENTSPFATPEVQTVAASYIHE